MPHLAPICNISPLKLLGACLRDGVHVLEHYKFHQNRIKQRFGDKTWRRMVPQLLVPIAQFVTHQLQRYNIGA
jgi:hypothetical protein